MGPTFDLSALQRCLLVVLAIVLQNVAVTVLGGSARTLFQVAAVIAFALAFGLAELAVSLWTGRWRTSATNRLRRS